MDTVILRYSSLLFPVEIERIIRPCQRRKYSNFCSFAKLETRFIQYIWNIRNKLCPNCFAKFHENVTKLTKCMFLASKQGQLFYSKYSVYTEYSKQVLFSIFVYKSHQNQIFDFAKNHSHSNFNRICD